MNKENTLPTKIPKDSLRYWRSKVSLDYLNIARELYSKSMNQEISNSNLDHAMFLSFLLIRKAHNKIRIFTEKINEIFFRNPLINKEFEEAIERGVEIHIIVSDGDLTDLPELYRKEKVFIHKLKNESPIKNHFLLSDNSAFRIEEPHSKIELAEKRIKGFANFNDPNLTQKISKVYDKVLLKNSEIIN